MRSYIQIMQSRYAGFKIRCSARNSNTSGDDSGELVKHWTSKQGTKSLIFDPQVGISVDLFGPNNTKANLLFDIKMSPLIADRIADVYNAVVDPDNKVYTKDDNGLYIIDKARAFKEYAQKIPSYSGVLEVYPGIDYEVQDSDNRCIVLQIDEIAAPFPLGKAKGLVSVLDKLDVLTYQVALGLMDQIAKVDLTTQRLERKIDMLLEDRNRADKRHNEPKVVYDANGRSTSSVDYDRPDLEFSWTPTGDGSELPGFDTFS